LNSRDSAFVAFSFSHIPDSLLMQQVEKRMANPALIDQGYTNLCGMAVCAMTLAKYDPQGYRKLIFNLNDNDFAQYYHYRLKLTKRISRMDRNYFRKGRLPEADWLLLATMRNKCNYILPYGGRMCNLYEKLAGSNYPSEIRHTLRLIGFEKLQDNMDGFWPIRKPARQTLLNLDSAFLQGHTPIILINTRMYKKGGKSLMSNHFVIYNGHLSFDDQNDRVTFNVWTFGYSGGQTITCPLEAFRNNYFGCIVVKKPEYLKQ
jgi:hypothetical protein